MTVYTTANFTSGNDTKTTSTGANFNDSLVDLQAGDDSIFGTGWQFSPAGINVKSGTTVRLGAGSDLLNGTASPGSVGIFVGANATIDGGDGNDRLIGRGANGTFSLFNVEFRAGALINLGVGNDTIDAGSTQAGGDLLLNAGSISMGDGADTILTGAIFNTFSGRSSSISGNGIIDMGSGDDRVVGFGRQTIYGGTGNDTLNLGTLPSSAMSVIGGPNQQVNIVANGITMVTYGFENFQFGPTTITPPSGGSQ